MKKKESRRRISFSEKPSVLLDHFFFFFRYYSYDVIAPGPLLLSPYCRDLYGFTLFGVVYTTGRDRRLVKDMARIKYKKKRKIIIFFFFFLL
jgi:hypothetical protein